MKRFLTIVLAFILFITPVFALPDGSERSTMEKYGVNKKWTIDSSNLNNVLRTPYFDASKKIYDYGDILTDEEESELYKLIGNYIEHTNMDMVILTIDMPYTYDKENEDYAADFYDYNDFGLDLDKYSGVLLLRNKYESDPYFNVYTFGEAQLYYDYNRCERMLDDIYPYFKSKSYLNGFKIFINDFTNYYDNGKALEDYYVDDMGYIHQLRVYHMPLVQALGAGGIVSLITILIMVKKNKMVKKSTEANDYIDKSTIQFHTKSDILTGSITTHHTIDRSSSGGGGGGFSSHSGSSGGGHGGGGGRHG